MTIPRGGGEKVIREKAIEKHDSHPLFSCPLSNKSFLIQTVPSAGGLELPIPLVMLVAIKPGLQHATNNCVGLRGCCVIESEPRNFNMEDNHAQIGLWVNLRVDLCENASVSRKTCF